MRLLRPEGLRPCSPSAWPREGLRERLLGVSPAVIGACGAQNAAGAHKGRVLPREYTEAERWLWWKATVVAGGPIWP